MAKAPVRKVEDAARLRYIRVLERFSNSIITYLFRSEAPTRDSFDKKVENNMRYLERAEKVPLYKGEYGELEVLVQRMVDYRNGDDTIEAIREDLLYRANQIEKSLNRRRYKKEKHASKAFDEWD